MNPESIESAAGVPSQRVLWARAALLPLGWTRGVRVTFAGGRIGAVESRATPGPGDELVDVLVPGVPNVHSHAFQRAMAGLTETKDAAGSDFWTWRDVMYRFVGRIDPDDLEAIAAFAFAEMLERGFTRVAEFHYLHHAIDGAAYADPAEHASRIAAAAATSGIGLTLLPVLYAHAGFGDLPPRAGQRRFVTDSDAFARLVDASRRAVRPLADAIVGVAAHSLRAVNARELAAAIALAGDAPFHIHVAEQTAEVEECRRHLGTTPIAWLLDHAAVDARWCLVHATHANESELAGAAERGAVVGLCPITEANLGDGIFQIDAWLVRHGAFGIGSDSNVLIDVAEELRLLEYTHRLQRRTRNVLAPRPGDSTARALLDGAWRGGAQAVGMPRPGSGIAVGALADLVSFDAEHPCLIGREHDALLDAWLFSGGGAAIDRVWSGGRRVVERGRHVAREAVQRRYAATLRKLLA